LSTVQAEYASKIRQAISNGISFIDQIVNDQKAESKKVEQTLWHAAEETEYAAAVLSLTHGLADFDPELKRDDLQRAGMDKRLSFARALLADGLDLLQSNPTLCYEKLRYAVQVLRRIQSEKSRGPR